ncbi:hypothetical protein SDC9_207822 [bioreactor metagenome]|uniref:Uncharacterized protein n=1 Tax=bioreactor metagenome TaxID=1076179 RepID=A0A645J9M0_9ZZZZ
MYAWQARIRTPKYAHGQFLLGEFKRWQRNLLADRLRHDDIGRNLLLQ